ncbi:hypothetical protein L917_21265 [Phytophthora nicotianae]|uniref:Uncharacterized protein n=1 Tax=Phytophthora nicotianae TaxID=4792 RepID=W2JY76_PHYNI|nr:hypothetical protein L917_21265 [Phytophthora nicotianae]
MITYICNEVHYNVCGDRRGHLITVILKMVSTDNNPFPVSLDTQKPPPLTAMVRRRFDGVGNELSIDRVRWRTLRSYELVAGTHDAPTAADRLGAAMKAAIHEALVASVAIKRAECEGISNRQPHRLFLNPELNVAARGLSRPSSPADFAIDPLPISSMGLTVPGAEIAPEGLAPNPLEAPAEAIMDLTADDEDTEVEGDTAEGVDGPTKDEEDVTIKDEVPSSPPWSRNKLRRIERVVETEFTDAQLRTASDFVKVVPTRWQRREIRHQRKVKAGDWSEGRSRKRRHQAMCGLTRSGTQLYHAHSTKAKMVKALLRLRGYGHDCENYANVGLLTRSHHHRSTFHLLYLLRCHGRATFA